MTDRSLGIIYTIKQKGTSDITLAAFLQKFYDTIYIYNRDEIDKILRETCADFIQSADDPMREIRRYFLNANTYSFMEIVEHVRMINFLQQTQISKDGNYINDFRDMEGDL